MSNKFKAFWIGETSEVYIGENPESIADHYDCEVMREAVASGDFGEIKDTSIMICDEEGNSVETIQQVLNSVDYICQIGSSY